MVGRAANAGRKHAGELVSREISSFRKRQPVLQLDAESTSLASRHNENTHTRVQQAYRALSIDDRLTGSSASLKGEKFLFFSKKKALIFE